MNVAIIVIVVIVISSCCCCYGRVSAFGTALGSLFPELIIVEFQLFDCFFIRHLVDFFVFQLIGQFEFESL